MTPTVRLGNICQISDKVARVSGTQEAVEHAGRDSEMNYQRVLKGLELKRDLEFILVGVEHRQECRRHRHGQTDGLDPVVDQDQQQLGRTGWRPGHGRRCGNPHRRHPEGVYGSAARSRCCSRSGPTAATPASSWWVGSTSSSSRTFTGRATPQENATSKKIVNSVDVYEGDFGTMKVVADRFMRSRDCLILDMDYWAVDYLRNMTSIELAKTGDSERRQILCEYYLVARNEKASGIVADLTAA